MHGSFGSHRVHVRAVAALAIVTVVAALRAHAGISRSPEDCAASIETRISSTRDSYHGTAVQDPYRWLEDWSDPAVRTWSEAQSLCARQYLDTRPDASQIRARLTQLLAATHGTSYDSLQFRAGRLFALRSTGQVQQPSLVWFADVDASGEPVLLLDMMRFDPSGQTSIDWYVPSPDGQLVAVSMSTMRRREAIWRGPRAVKASSTHATRAAVRSLKVSSPSINKSTITTSGPTSLTIAMSLGTVYRRSPRFDFASSRALAVSSPGFKTVTAANSASSCVTLTGIGALLALLATGTLRRRSDEAMTST